MTIELTNYPAGEEVILSGEEWGDDDLPGDPIRNTRKIVAGQKLLPGYDKSTSFFRHEGSDFYIYSNGEYEDYSAIPAWEYDLLNPPEEKSAVDPEHYKFGDVEVRQISGHLTSFGGQALQYVAQATRLDGHIKGDAVEDLTKAIRFIQWEIERLQSE